MLIRRYAPSDHADVRALFIAVNREVAPPAMREAFEAYIACSLAEEIDRIEAYYAEKQGAFFVAQEGAALAGMFGLEGLGTTSAELRRMYVDRAQRGSGLAQAMLAHAEATCRATGTPTLALSTSELQGAALAFYRKSGYRLVREEAAAAQTNKTVGGNLRRFYFEKRLDASR
ncbi:MAG: GNAT family N-acetyltransferase [Alphaproteobacteria bacterium]|nr:GNAT family N-acetyltransferase [Alphaproteobacteria bacterium]